MGGDWNPDIDNAEDGEPADEEELKEELKALPNMTKPKGASNRKYLLNRIPCS